MDIMVGVWQVVVLGTAFYSGFMFAKITLEPIEDYLLFTYYIPND